MKKLSLFILMLTSISSTLLYAQQPDTIRCYTITELKNLAMFIVECNMTDSLLQIADHKNTNYVKLIKEKEFVIDRLEIENDIRNARIKEQDEELKYLTKKIKRQRIKLKVTGYTLLCSIIGFLSYIVFIT